MTDFLARARPETCASDLRLDRLNAGELSPEVERATRDHLTGCALCARRMVEIERARDAFARTRPPLRARPVSGRPRWRRWAPAAAALAAAAVLVLWLATDATVAPGNRTKGPGSLTLFVRRAGGIEPAGPDQVVRPGESLGFTVSLREPRHVAVLSVDGARRASIYFPAGPTAARLGPGQDLVLPGSVVLDDVLGDEVLYGLLCEHGLELEPVRAALAAAPERTPAPEGCTVQRMAITKRAAP
jgi:hypothetical protein